MRSRISHSFVALALVVAGARAAPWKTRAEGDPMGVQDGGDATFYTPGVGACGKTNTESDLMAAVSHDFFDTFPGATANPNANPLCGMIATVNYQGKTVDVALLDRCESCAYVDLDLSPAAFSQLGSFDAGRLHGLSWQIKNGDSTPSSSSSDPPPASTSPPASSTSTDPPPASTETSSSTETPPPTTSSSTETPTTTTSAPESTPTEDPCEEDPTMTSSDPEPTPTDDPCEEDPTTTTSMPEPTPTDDPCEEDPTPTTTTDPEPTPTDDPCEEDPQSTPTGAPPGSGGVTPIDDPCEEDPEPTPTGTPAGSGGSCTDNFDPSKVYVGGDSAIYQGHNWKAKWWTQGPAPGADEVWEDSGAC